MFDFISKLIYGIVYIFAQLGLVFYFAICLTAALSTMFATDTSIVLSFLLIIAWYIVYKHEKDNKKD